MSSYPRTRTLCYAALPAGYSFREGIVAARRAGFEEVSLWQSTIADACAELGSLEDLHAFLDEQGMATACVEFLHKWCRDDDTGAREEFASLLDAAVTLGAGVMMLGCMDNRVPDRPAAVARLVEFAGRAAADEVALAMEFLPWSAIPDLASAQQWLLEVGSDNIGLVLDTWHFARSGQDYAALAAVPRDCWRFIQISDAAAEPGPDIIRETLGGRLAPGAGVVDWFRLLDVLVGEGLTCPIGTEQFSDQVKAMPLQEAADYLFRTCQQPFIRHGDALS